jgi:hypothetical protein
MNELLWGTSGITLAVVNQVVLGDKQVLVPLCLPQIPHEVASESVRSSVVGTWRPIT